MGAWGGGGVGGVSCFFEYFSSPHLKTIFNIYNKGLHHVLSVPKCVLHIDTTCDKPCGCLLAEFLLVLLRDATNGTNVHTGFAALGQ